MATTTCDTETENHVLRQQFLGEGLDLADVWRPNPGDPELDNRQLRALRDWVDAYRRCGGRAELRRQGYEFPPVEPDCDPETDWIRFERWLSRRPVTWSFVETHGEMPCPDALNEVQVAEELARIETLLAERNVCLAFQDAVPAREVYIYLWNELRETRFDFTGPRTYCHLDGCTGECAACFQQPWCEVFLDDELEW